MNNLRKLFSLLLAFALVLSMSVTALARETDGELYSAVVRFDPGADVQEMCDALEELPGVSIRWRYSALIHGAAIEGTRAALKLAGKQVGISAMALSRTWSAPETVTDPLYSSNSLDLMNMTDCAYDGDGTVIAVLDSGIKISHEAFADYGIMDDTRLTREDIEAYVAAGGTDGRYISAKIPFAYDYSGKDRSVNTADRHGTHVSALAVGYAQREDGSVKFRGAASAAQLLCMKVFPDKAELGASDVDILKAMDDAYVLGADVINLSLGMTDPFLEDEQIGEVYSDVVASLEAAGVIVCCAVGNSAVSTTGKPGDTALPTGRYTDYASASAPAIYRGAQAIAAVNSTFYEAGGGMLVGDRAILYTEMTTQTEGEVLPSIETLAGQEMPYVLIGGVGSKEDFAGVDLTGCAAVVQRGEIYFSEKANNAAAAGAALCIIYNNEPGEILPAADGITIPCVMITQEDGAYLVEEAENGRGTIAVAPHMMRIDTGEKVTMFPYSSWGASPELLLVPTLSAPGGTILSAGIGADDAYDYLSGTSMAAPNAAGAYAVMLQALRERGVTDRVQALKLAKSLLESTAATVTDENNIPLSPRRQGAGVIDVAAALRADAVIEEPVLSLGESDNGRFTILFTVKNLSEREMVFAVDTTVLTDAFALTQGAARSMLSPLEITERVTVSGVRVIRVAPLEERTVELTLSVSMKTVQELKKIFPNGFFTEGYVTLTDEENRAIHATFMGYCGDWEAAPIIDSVDFRDVMNAYYAQEMGDEDALAALAADMGYNYASRCGANLDAENALLPGENPWLVTPASDARSALSTAHSDAMVPGGNYLVIDLFTLRNAEHLIFMVYDRESGEIYCVDDRAYLVHSIVLASAGAAASAARFVWDGTNREGMILPDGTEVTVAFYAWLETETQFGDAYDTHKKEIRRDDYDWLLGGEFEECVEWSFPLVLDASAPQVSCRVDESGDAVIAVTDGQFTAYAAVQDEASNYLAEDAYAGTCAGETYTLFDARQEYSGKTLYVTVADYAGNATGYEIDLTGQASGDVAVRRCPVAMLTDVPKDAWYHDAVDFVIDRGLMSVGASLAFSPDQGALRVMVLNMLYDLAGSPQMEPGTVTLPFRDASNAAAYRAALEWAYREGIVTGYDDTLFGAYAPVQRAHLAAMLWRAARAAGEDVSCHESALSGFADTESVPEWAREAFGWALEKGYLSSDAEGNLLSGNYVTRAEFAQLLMMLYREHDFEEDMSNGVE